MTNYPNFSFIKRSKIISSIMFCQVKLLKMKEGALLLQSKVFVLS